VSKRLPDWINCEKLLAEERDLRRRLALIERIKEDLRVGAQGRGRLRVRTEAREAAGRSTWLEEMVRALRNCGRPLHWRELYDELGRRRPGTEWKVPSAVLRSIVRRAVLAGDDRVERAGRGRYALSEWRPAPAAAFPARVPGARETPIHRLAEEVLREARRPLHGHEILKRLEARGRTVGGRNPLNTLFGILSRERDRFVNIGGNVWQLAARPDEGRADRRNGDV
jgi:hypothetical protein